MDDITEPVLIADGDQVKWLTDPEAKGPHRYTFGVVTGNYDPDHEDEQLTWEIALPNGTVRYVVPFILIKVPGRHLSKGRP